MKNEVNTIEGSVKRICPCQKNNLAHTTRYCIFIVANNILLQCIKQSVIQEVSVENAAVT